MKLTPTQHAAWLLLREKGEWHAYDGVSRSTIAVLERHGLVTVKWSVQTWWNRRSGRNHSMCDWTATVVDSKNGVAR
ncbi:hypothetical protein [Streptomyces sp. NPDC058698]|uniref:hypothetical protein n=1 Tax=Streptomyces sp. NPDC058698 TaxID=3346606 RepID=UPI00364ABAD9